LLALQERDRARLEAAKAQQLVTLLNEMLSAANPFTRRIAVTEIDLGVCLEKQQRIREAEHRSSLDGKR
ncbi:MAG: hypothetical protein AAB393_04205, partial [Bacteroidota bacterium]